MKIHRAIAIVAALSVAGVAAAAPHGPTPKAGAPKASVQKPKSGPSSAHGGASKQSGKSARSGKSIDSPKKGHSTTTATTTTTTAVTTTETAPPNAISTKISGKPDQLARIQAMLPEGMTLEQATAGFKNQGQFIAALNAAKNNPDLKFVDLQKAMTEDGLSLGQAVKQLKAAPAPAPTTTTPPPGGGSL